MIYETQEDDSGRKWIAITGGLFSLEAHEAGRVRIGLAAWPDDEFEPLPVFHDEIQPLIDYLKSLL